MHPEALNKIAMKEASYTNTVSWGFHFQCDANITDGQE